MLLPETPVKLLVREAGELGAVVSSPVDGAGEAIGAFEEVDGRTQRAAGVDQHRGTGFVGPCVGVVEGELRFGVGVGELAGGGGEATQVEGRGAVIYNGEAGLQAGDVGAEVVADGSDVASVAESVDEGYVVVVDVPRGTLGGGEGGRPAGREDRQGVAYGGLLGGGRVGREGSCSEIQAALVVGTGDAADAA